MSYLDSDKKLRVGFPVFTKLNVYTFQGILVIRHSIISAKIKMPPETFGAQQKLWANLKTTQKSVFLRVCQNCALAFPKYACSKFFGDVFKS